MTARILKNSILAGLPFGFAMGLFFILMYGLTLGVVGGVASGILFGIIMAIFAETQIKKMESKNGCFEGEDVLYQGPANHFLKIEGRGGWLTLTQTRLAFRSHGKNVQNTPLDIFLEDIVIASKSTTLGIIPNGLLVVTGIGKLDSFVVSSRKHWVNSINKARTELQR